MLHHIALFIFLPSEGGLCCIHVPSVFGLVWSCVNFFLISCGLGG